MELTAKLARVDAEVAAGASQFKAALEASLAEEA